jgi:hypothetical protein
VAGNSIDTSADTVLDIFNCVPAEEIIVENEMVDEIQAAATAGWACHQEDLDKVTSLSASLEDDPWICEEG